MAFKGHIKLDNKEYRLRQLPTRTLANQMAPAIGQGTSKYQDLTSWAAWVQKDWQDGVGRLDPLERGGFLYGEVESRVPSQLILPGLVRQVDTRDTDGTTSDCRFMPEDVADYFLLSLNGAVSNTLRNIAIPFRTPAGATTYDTLTFWVYAYVTGTTALLFDIYSDSGGSPNASLHFNTTASLNPTPGPAWIGVSPAAPSGGTLSSSTNYWLVISVVSSGTTCGIAYASSGYGSASKNYNGSTWVTQTNKFALFSSQIYHLGAATTKGTGVGFFRFNNVLYHYAGATLYKYDTTNDQWDSVGAITDHHSVTSAVPFGTKVYFGNGGLTTTDYTTMNTSEAFTSTGTNAYLFAKHNGYLWRSYGNELEYSGDGTVWEPTATHGDPITVGDPAFPITGMAGLGNEFYVATTEALYQIVRGADIALGVDDWGGIDDFNGASMVQFEGALYCTVNGRVVRFTEDQRFQDVWLTRDDDLMAQRIGRVWHLARMNNWLIAIVGGVEVLSTITSPTVWALQGSSWHHIATLPNAYDWGAYSAAIDTPDILINHAVFYDRETKHLWMATPGRLTYKVRIPDFTLNPYNDSETVYMPAAWVEWDWFDGTIFDVEKDFESVKIIGENLAAGQSIKAYWKDDDSTGWESLGTATSNLTELRWDIDRGDRPATRRFKLGLLLSTTDGSETPRLRAVIVKYLPMLRDWFQWQLAIDVSGTTHYPQEGSGSGEVNTRTASTLNSELETIAKATGIFLYQDVDGRQYEVKVKGGNFQYTKHEYNQQSSTVEWEGIWNLTIEQAHPDEYS